MGTWALSPAEWEAVRLSLLVGTTAVVASMPAGIVLGWILARKRFWGKNALETVLNLPLVLPPVVTGYLLLFAFGRQGWIGSRLEQWFGLRVVFDWKGAALAAGVISFPLMVRAMRLAFLAVDERLERASRTLGASGIDTFFTITLPLARHGLIAGCVLSFARSVGEFGATIMIAGNIPGKTRTIPLYVFSLLESPGGAEQAYRVVIVSVLIASGALILGEIMERRGRERIYAV